MDGFIAKKSMRNAALKWKLRVVKYLASMRQPPGQRDETSTPVDHLRFGRGFSPKTFDRARSPG
jgi:hypothetical protein